MLHYGAALSGELRDVGVDGVAGALLLLLLRGGGGPLMLVPTAAA